MCAQDNSFSHERFVFRSEAVPEEHALPVIRFSGTEGLSELYCFTIRIATQKKSLPLEDMLTARAHFTIRAALQSEGGADGAQDAVFSGYISSIVQTSRYNDWTFYELTLHPGLWYYTRSVQNNFFIGRTVRQLLEECLGKLDSFQPDYEFRLTQHYEPQDFSMQNNESLYDYMAWKMERDGLYYFFEEGTHGERLVITDSRLTHTTIPGPNPLHYSPGSGMEGVHREEVIPSFSLTCSPLPARVILREYDWLNPNRPLVGTCQVSPAGMGDVYYYGEGFTTTAEGNRLAELRAEALRCTNRVCSGTSANPYLRPGCCFGLDGHYDPSFNREYLLTSVCHEGSQEAWLSQAIGVPISNADRLYYRNSFTCISSDVQFRPARTTQRNKVSGMITAFIDSAGDAAVAEINDKGCYKVVFPQDISNHAHGSASCWLRRMQPHVGKAHGFSFPLTPGVEVLIAFLDGNPDRPVIAGALSNAESGYMENPSSAQATALQSSGGGGLAFNDTPEKQGAILNSGGRSAIMMSAGSADALAEFTDNAYETVSSTAIVEAGMSHSLEAGFTQSIKAGHSLFTNGVSNAMRGLQVLANGLEWAEKMTEDYMAPEESEESSKSSTSSSGSEKTTSSAESSGTAGKGTGTTDSGNAQNAQENQSDNEEDTGSEETESEEKQAKVKQGVLDSISYLATTLKAAAQAKFTYDMLKETVHNKYSAVLASGNTSSELQLATHMDSAAISKYLVFWGLISLANSQVFNALAIGTGEKAAANESISKKRSMGRQYTSVALPTLLSEITAAVVLLKTLRGSSPKGMLINAENGPLVSAAQEEEIRLAGKGMVLTSFKNAQTLASLTQDLLLTYAASEAGAITMRSETNTSLTTGKTQVFSLQNITARAPSLELGTAQSDACDTEKNRLSTYFPQEEAAGNMVYSEVTNKTALLRMNSTATQSTLALENTGGAMSLTNSDGKMSLTNKGSLLIENTAAATADEASPSLIIRHKGSSTFSLTCKDATCSLTDDKGRGFSLEDATTLKLVNSASQSLTMDSGITKLETKVCQLSCQDHLTASAHVMEFSGEQGITLNGGSKVTITPTLISMF